MKIPCHSSPNTISFHTVIVHKSVNWERISNAASRSAEYCILRTGHSFNVHFDWCIHCGATFIFPSIISSSWCITTSCVKHRKEVISFLLRGHRGRRVGWGQYRSAGRKRSVSVTATARERRKLWACRPERVKTAARFFFFLFFLADNKLLRCHGVFSGNHSLSCGESDAGCWETAILFQAGCGGQQALWPRKHFGQNTPLKLAWPSVCL